MSVTSAESWNNTGAIAGAYFFTTEVWTWRGWSLVLPDLRHRLASRRVPILGSTPHREALFMQQTARTLMSAPRDQEVGREVEHWEACTWQPWWVEARVPVRRVAVCRRECSNNCFSAHNVRSMTAKCLETALHRCARTSRRN